MIRTIIFVAAVALVVAGALWVADSPGVVTLSVGDWRVGVPLPLFALAVFLVAVIAALIYRFWRSLRRAPSAAREFFHRRGRDKGYKALTQGMVAVAAGDAHEAARQARRANALLDEPPLTMLLSAQAAQLNGDETAATRYFTAMLEREETAFLGLRGLLMQAERDGERGEALALARRAHALQPKTPWVLTTLLDLEVAEHHWREAIEAVDQALKNKAIEPDKARRTKATLMLASSQAAEDAGNAEEAMSFARKAHSQAPDYLPASIRYATLSADAGRRRAAVKIIEDTWAKTPHAALAALYGRLEDASDPLKGVKRFEKLLSLNRDHPESHIALAEALLKAKIWGAARSHLDKAGSGAPSARICRLMAALEDSEHGDMAAVRAWLLRATYADPDPAWICADCGSAADNWVPVCSRCGALGSLDWKAPPRAAALDSAASGLLLPLGEGADDNLPAETSAARPAGQAGALTMPPPDVAGPEPRIIDMPVEADASYDEPSGGKPAGNNGNSRH